jgi:hypothetical protein
MLLARFMKSVERGPLFPSKKIQFKNQLDTKEELPLPRDFHN